MADMIADDGWSCDDLTVEIGEIAFEDEPSDVRGIELIITDKDGGTAEPYLYAEDVRSLVDYLQGWFGK